MSKYYYEVIEIPHEDYAELKIGGKFKGGVVVDGVGGIDGECLVVVGYKIVGEENG